MYLIRQSSDVFVCTGIRKCFLLIFRQKICNKKLCKPVQNEDIEEIREIIINISNAVRINEDSLLVH